MNESKNKPTKIDAFIWLGLGAIPFFILFLAAIALPNFIKARATSAQNACINNLRQIDSAANQFALENHKTNGTDIHFPDDLKPYIKFTADGHIPACPSGGSYSLTKVGDTPICSLGTAGDPRHKLP